MIKIKRFSLFVLIIILIFLLTSSILYLTAIFSYSQFISVLLALIITTLNFLAGTISAKISLNKKEKTFIKIVFGSMVIRLFLMLTIILIVFVFLDINRNSFIFSIFIFYIFYLLIEVFYLNFIKN
jgi:hypothetical protein